MIQDTKKLKFYIPLILVIAFVIVAGIYWYRDYSRYITTDDAYIESDNVAISSKILGRVVIEYVKEGDSVKTGMLLACIDSSDLIAQEHQAVSLKEQASSAKLQTEASYFYDQENIKVLQVNFDKAKEDYDRAKTQYDGGISTKEAFDHTTKSYESAKAQMNASASSLSVSKAKIESANAAIKSAEAQVVMIQTQLKNTRLYAPMNGIIAKRWLLPGDVVGAGQSVFTVTGNEKYWVIAYVEETKITQIHIGQKVLFSIDAFSDAEFYGKVFNIGANTASQFSLIPPNNASGNFTKITQRIPIKISIEGNDRNDRISSLKILAGMSAEVKFIKN
ncbi:MAG: HlyD family secretion protein [Bacteroidota bacterium]